MPWQLPAPGFPADLAPEPRVPQPRDPFFIGAPDASLPPSAFPLPLLLPPLRFSFPLLSIRLLSSLFFSFRWVETIETETEPKEVVDRRHKEISRAISRLRHATTRTLPRAYTRAHTHTRVTYPLTHRQCVPLSYQLIAGRSLSAWDVFSHGLHFPRSPPCARPRVPTRPVSAAKYSPLQNRRKLTSSSGKTERPI